MSTPDFTAAASRARGLATHLFPRAELEKLLTSEASLLPRALARSGRLGLPLSENASPVELEAALRQTHTHTLRLLSRWAGAAPVLEVFAAEADRRSIRALLRGALQAAPAEQRLAGLLPTTTLPERVLRELARKPTPAAVVSHLFALDHPDAARLWPLTVSKAQPELFALELALLQGFAERTRRALKQSDATLRAHVALCLDLANAQTALLLAGSHEGDPLRAFVEGGRALSRVTFEQVASAASASAGLGLLTRAMGAKRSKRPRSVRQAPVSGSAGASTLGLLLSGTVELSTLERRGFSLCLAQARRAARELPLGSGPVIHFLLRLEAMGRDLRRLAWAAALHAPPAFVRPELVTP